MPAVAPSEFPPPFDPAAVVGPPTDAAEDRIEVGIAIVGGGPAGLACANKLMQLLESEPELTEKLGEVPVAVIEKGKVAGAHLLSGANMKPSAMEELFPDLDKSEWPVYQEVTKDAVYLLTKSKAIPLKPPPPNFRNHGNYVTSVSKLGRFLADKAEEAGVYILSETAATKLLVEDRVVRGVRSGDRGRGKDGQELPNFEPGSDVVAKATVLAEGTVGHLTYAAYDYFDLHGADPMRWELGVKEVWEVKEPLDRVIHTMGWPLRKGAKYNEFGGSFIYPMGEDKICIGLVAGLDYTDATFSVHDALQLLKTHPFVRKLIDGGKRVAWGAKTIPSGGYYAMPKRLAVPGMVVAGDAASMVNIPTLKGVHYAMHAGMYAAETIVEALKQDPDSVNFEAYDEKVHNSMIEKDLYNSRNVRQAFSKGFFVGGAVANGWALTKGAFPPGHWKGEDDAENEMEIGKAGSTYVKPDNEITFNKLDSVFLSGNATRDDAPNHVRIQTRVPREVAQTWVSMCPAQVYEIPEEQLAGGNAEVDVHVTASNCVQCGAITAKGGRLTLPEGGDGPLYQET
jgi:electron-transferring-flavoprotein dehydrogenase